MGEFFPWKFMKKPPQYPKVIVAILLLGLGVALTFVWMQRHGAANERAFTGSREIQKSVDSPASRFEETAQKWETPTTPPGPAGGAPQFDSFRLRPFAAVKSTGAHEWTAEDARSPEAIRNIAHNETEVARLTEENARIKRRQLVYRKETAFKQVQRALAAGQPVRKLILPGLDGQEVEMEVVNADIAPSGMSGTFAGRLPGKGQSMATLAFKEGREAFSVMSPEDETFLQGHPREPGEIIVTSFDPDTYQPLPGGEPIKTPEDLETR
jgi:hypothetical protein